MSDPSITKAPDDKVPVVNNISLETYTPSLSFWGVHDVYYRPFFFHDGRVDGSVWIQGENMGICSEVEGFKKTDNNNKVKLDMIPYTKEAKGMKYELEDLKHKFIFRKAQIQNKDGKKDIYYLIYKNYLPDLTVSNRNTEGYDVTELYKKKEKNKNKPPTAPPAPTPPAPAATAAATAPAATAAATAPAATANTNSNNKQTGGKDTVTGFLSNMFNNKSNPPKSKENIEAILQRISSDLTTVTDMVKRAKAKGAFPDEEPKEKPKENPKDQVTIEPNTFVLWAVSFKGNEADYIEVYDFVVHSIQNKNKFLDNQEYGLKMNEKLLKLPFEEVKEESIYVYKKREISRSAIMSFSGNSTLTWDAIGTYMKVLKSFFGVDLKYMKVVEKDVNGNPLSIEEEEKPYIFINTVDTNIGEGTRKSLIEDNSMLKNYNELVGKVATSTGNSKYGATQDDTINNMSLALNTLADPNDDEDGDEDDEDEKLTTKYGGKGKSRKKHTRPKSKTFKRRQ
jgi:hypothetical protein